MKIPRKLYFEKAPEVPNSPLPVLLIRSALAPNASRRPGSFVRRLSATAGQGFGRTRFTTTRTFIPMRMKCSESQRGR